MPRTSQNRWQIWVAPLALFAVGLIASVDTANAQPAPAGSSVPMILPIFGNTPSLAWSPDGQRLAYNQAYEYFGSDAEIAAHQLQLGLYVYEPATTSVRQLVNDQRYHPAWLGNDVVAAVCTTYEDCDEGLYLHYMNTSQRRILSGVGTYHTQAVSETELAYYSGFPGDYQWHRVDSTTMATRIEAPGLCSWDPPATAIDQCVQQAGDTRVWIDGGLWMQRGAEAAVLLDSATPYFYSSPGPSGACVGTYSGPVAPCLSPTGQQVAYVSAEGPSGMAIHVHSLSAP